MNVFLVIGDEALKELVNFVHHDLHLGPASVFWDLSPIPLHENHDCSCHHEHGGWRRPKGLELCKVGLVQSV